MGCLMLTFLYLGCEYDELKSPISLVHEIALKRSLPVSFEVNTYHVPPTSFSEVFCVAEPVF